MSPTGVRVFTVRMTAGAWIFHRRPPALERRVCRLALSASRGRESLLRKFPAMPDLQPLLTVTVQWLDRGRRGSGAGNLSDAITAAQYSVGPSSTNQIQVLGHPANPTPSVAEPQTNGVAERFNRIADRNRSSMVVIYRNIAELSGRRPRNWNNHRPDLKEDLAHLVQDIKRRICGIASAGSPSFSV